MAGTIDRREVRAVALGASIVAGYTACVLASGRVDGAAFARLFSSYLHMSFSLWAAVGTMSVLLLLYLHRPRPGQPIVAPTTLLAAWMADRWRRDRLVSLIWPPILFAALMAGFNAFKQMVLPAAGFGFDGAFAAVDRILFLGRDPWTVTHLLFGGRWATMILDSLYHGWFVPMSLGVAVCAFLAADAFRLRTQYLLTYMGIWILIGSLAAFAVPSMGPCFTGALLTGPDPFGDLVSELTRLDGEVRATIGTGLVSLDNQRRLLALYGSDRLTIGAGISAMPSVHNALAVLFALAARRVGRTAGQVMTGYAVLIWIGSIHLGWHYACDGIVAALMTIAIWRGSGRVVDWLERGRASSQPHPQTGEVALG